MTLQWTLIAAFLYAEIGIVILLLLPFISATRWRSLFKSRLFSAVSSYANYYFGLFMIILILLFVDALREVRNYSNALDKEESKITPNTETSLHMKLFRAQRNLYVAGFTVFLFLVLRRLVVLINCQSILMADRDATRKQAESASAAAKKFMDDQDNKTNDAGIARSNKELKDAKEEITKLKEKLNHSLTDVEAMKQQSVSTSREYDRLVKEVAALQDQIDGKSSEPKKDL